MSEHGRGRVGLLEVDAVDWAGALSWVESRVTARLGGYVVTPNVDHVVKAENDEAFRNAYAAAALSVCDGKPVQWASRLLGTPLPAKISGSDLMLAVSAQAAERGWRVYLLGSSPERADRAANALRARGVTVCGHDSPRFDRSDPPSAMAPVLEALKRASPDILFVAMGAPKQELWMHRHVGVYAPALAFGIGAGLDFLAGDVPRAPRWMSENGLEWAYRLAREPRRLWRRYLVDDPAFAAIVLRQWVATRRRGR